MKRIFTRFVLGGGFALLCYVLLILYAFSVLGENFTPKTDDQLTFSGQMSTYLINDFFLSGESTVLPPNNFLDYFRPELKKALEDGAITKIPRRDFNKAIEKMFGSHKKFKSMKSKAVWCFWGLAVFSLVIFFVWVLLHDPVLKVIDQYKKGRLYNVLGAEIVKKDQLIEQQKNQIAHLKTKYTETETAYSTLDQKFKALYNQVREKVKAENEAKENLKKEAEEKKALKEEAENAFN